ncbi:hypothetical protein WJX72_003368 [[Myrmecia] bisecta]|uniref:Structural maintenance of chromosomes protein n=1 Tax=[Myrmecia] bisecta TaxID=41462 RepID=A0AAW1R5F5_9CHLO
MHIEEITLEGFKSYAQRVTVPNFDQYFNAITGLNGSGKSNILDSICFVLGITDLKQVRAGSLQELVYKQGQAGVTKATVSIVFNNSDKKNSPTGYEQYDQITVTRQLVIGGRNKYLINGHVAQPSRVQNLFHSVQLNVNNPHFLIMQGRITKVLNMKPPEILGMLEEAAGTRMYETKKEGALKTLDKKQVKVEEINRVLAEDILPALEKLRREKGQYMEWQAASANLDRLRRFCIAWRYVEAERSQSSGSADMSSIGARIEDLTGQHAELAQEIQDKEGEIQSLQTEKELQAGGEVKELAETADSLSKKLVKDTTSLKNKQETVEGERAACRQIQASIAELAEEGLAAKVQQASAASQEAQASCDAAAQAVEAAQRELAGAEAGDGRDESNKSLQERLADAQNAQTAAEADAKQADMKAKHLQKQLAEQRKALGSKETEAAKLQKDLQRKQSLVEECTTRLSRLEYDEEAAQQLEATCEREGAEVQRCKERVDELSSQLGSMNFQYRDPERNFDRSKVKGVVATLVRIQDPTTTTALEVAAGGKLYQVVVDTEQTAKALLSNGQLRNRVTIIPLNKVSSRAVPASVVNAAQRLSHGKATLALELVGYDAELSAAMQYAFGGAFVCKDSATAKSLAFNKDVRTRCVTLEGDDFNPGGTLTGGSRNNSSSVLARLHAVAEAMEELEAHRAVLGQAQQALQQMAAATKEHKRLSQELELKQHALGLLQERIRGSESAQLAEAVSTTEAEMAGASTAAEAARERKKAMVAAAKELESQIANFGKERDKHIKAAQAKVKSAKAGLEAAKKLLKAAQQALAEAVAEKEAAAGERATLAEQLDAAEKGVTALQKEVDDLTARVAQAKAAYDVAAGQLAERRERLKQCDLQINELAHERNALTEKLTGLAVERKKLEHKLNNMQKRMDEAANVCTHMEQEYPWIASEKAHFSKAGGDYDWEAKDPNQATQEYLDAEAAIARLGKNLNKRVMQMYDKANAEYDELTAKKRIVENDKQKIQTVIAELDEKKREALEKTWLKVNQDFGSIFSTLLPGTSAKLDPVEGHSFLDGLEVKVAFGGVWKQSLTELSGGQRSLLALSLILAMLLFKPAPIYILDEVDAALDLSHTQNIGRMIKTHFPYSQFIVVSLKEGMFSNANVIFRTKFVDGVSAVTRTINEAARRQEGDAGGRGKGARPNRPALTENVRH